MRHTTQNSFQNLVLLNERTSTILGSERFRYGFNKMEADDELKGEGNSYDFGARMLDPRLGKWFSPDDWESKYPSWSTYNFVKNNPIGYNDPTGNGPEWKPIVKNGNIVLLREKGDNALTLANFLDVKQEVADDLWNSRCPDGSVELNFEIPGVKNISFAILDYKENPDKYGGGVFHDNYDCHESSLSLLSKTWIDKDNIIEGRDLNDALQNGPYEELKDENQSIFGQTLIRFGNSAGDTKHSATYLGTSNDGTVYTWSKNGDSDKPAIYTVDQLKKIYNSEPQSAGSQKGSGFYNPVLKTNPYEKEKAESTTDKSQKESTKGK